MPNHAQTKRHTADGDNQLHTSRKILNSNIDVYITYMYDIPLGNYIGSILSMASLVFSDALGLPC